MNDTCICDNVPKVWRLTGVTRTLRLRTFNPDGTPLDLTGRTVGVTIARDNSEFVYAPGFVIEGDDRNVVKFEWPADQQGAGDYTINVTTTDGSGNADRVNWHGPTGIRLVDFSFMVRGEDALGVTSEANIGLDGTFTMNGAGMSAYDEWLVEGHTGTPEDFIVWLRQPAEDAATEAEATVDAKMAEVDADMAAIEATAAADHTRAENDHTTSTGDHTRAEADHVQAVTDSQQAATDHHQAEIDAAAAAIDREKAATDRTKAANYRQQAEADHATAAQDHATASSDHQQAQSDHSTASADHTQATQDAERAASDHTRAGDDHDTAVEDHQQAEADHTRAEADHTTAAADHTTAASDHTQATADHEVMAGYDTRLGNVEGEVSQLGQKVDELDTFKVSVNRSFVQAREVEKDLLFADTNGNVLVKFSDGHIKTKKFDSSLIKTTVNVIPELSPKDLNISDENGKTIFRVVGGYPQTKFFSHQLFGKRISIIGDSISTFAYTTSGDYSGCINPYVNYYQSADTDVHKPEDTWFGQLATKSGAIINRVASYGGGDVVTTLKEYYKKVYSNGTVGMPPDIIFVFAGSNDWGHNRPLGTLDDYKNNDTSTFYGAYCYLLDKLQETFPNAVIYAMTPIYSAYFGTGIPYDTKNSARYTIRDIADIINEICREFGVCSIDTNKDCGLNRHNYSIFMFDQTHPKRDGLGKIANVVFNKLK